MSADDAREPPAPTAATGPADHTGSPDASRHCLPRLNGIFVRALKALGGTGQTDLACRLAAEAWSAIRNDHPGEAERLNKTLHYLTRPTPNLKKESDHADR
ncbi:MAG TPA: hypothetical protein VKY65_22550 [Alphaproteobacteria bacterium]|nr:hypothetical protein [Alphaproteobacteria bacterium]